MTRFLIIITLLLAAAGPVQSRETDHGLDSNTAFYEGETLDYTVTAPNGFRLVIDLAKIDGYSFAFVPENDRYDSAAVLIGVHIYKIRGMTFKEALESDTSAVRGHYGANLILNPVDSVRNATRQLLTTFYLDDKTRFIPNVMMAYFGGETELLVFELVITPGVLRTKAEEIFMTTLSLFRALKKGELSQLR